MLIFLIPENLFLKAHPKSPPLLSLLHLQFSLLFMLQTSLLGGMPVLLSVLLHHTSRVRETLCFELALHSPSTASEMLLLKAVARGAPQSLQYQCNKLHSTER